MDLRKYFFDIMCEITDKDTIVIVGDLGYSKMEEYALKHPNKFMNIGCMEQSMVGIGAGMAHAGKKVYIYSNQIFLVMRAYEQIRDDICYNNLPVKLIGTGANGFLGFSHNLEGRENINTLLSNLPNIKIHNPKNKKELKKALLSKGTSFIQV